MSSEKSYKTLQSIWDKLSKPAKDGKKWLTFRDRNDLVYLYSTGFVDEKQYTLQDWIKAFDDSRQADGSYLIAEGSWMDKVKFHYAGPIGVPFDPLDLRDGDWTEADMEKVIVEKILPSIYFTEAEFRKIFDEVKPTFFLNGVYKLNSAVKKDLKELIDLIPSPAHVRALGVAEARGRASPGSKSAGVSTGFSSGPSQSEAAAQRLANILLKK